MKSQLRNQRGMAMIEAVPLLILFAVLLSFSLGFFGVVHTAILNSISARAYAFETFRSRTDLRYFREDGSALASVGPLYLGRKEFRFHAINHENDLRAQFVATTRNIALGTIEKILPATANIHNSQIYQILARNQKIEVNPAWVMVGYGICLNPSCGGSP